MRHRIAGLSVELEAARLLTYRAAVRLDAGHAEAAASVAMAKYHAARAANKIVDECLQVFGGSGFLEETPVARHYRDVRVLQIGGGTDEIQLEILSKGLAGLRPSPTSRCGGDFRAAGGGLAGTGGEL